MEVHHPHAHPLSDDEQALLVRFREKLQARVAQGGLTADDVRRILKAMGGHEELGVEMMRALNEEVRTLLPGQSLFSFTWE
ncbi:MAG: hypothetical protein VKJ05_04040 [Synechococcaceae cyanobacterium]|nr:hypothetical protein [Synechococcaceae cyanobacterium]